MTRMKNKLKLGADAYIIKFVAHCGSDPDKDPEETWNMDTETIEVKNCYGPKLTLRTILHGMFHAVLESRGYYLQSAEDEFVDALAMGLGDAMLQSPKFFRELLDTYT